MSEAKEPKAKRPAGPHVAPVAPPAAAAEPHVAAAAAPAMVTPVEVAEKIAAATVVPEPVRQAPEATADKLFSTYRTALASIGESQRAIVSGVSALALETTGLAKAGLTDAGDSAAALTRARSFSDAVEIQLDFARRSFAAMAAGSTRLSEIAARLANEATRPIVAPFSRPAQG